MLALDALESVQVCPVGCVPMVTAKPPLPETESLKVNGPLALTVKESVLLSSRIICWPDCSPETEPPTVNVAGARVGRPPQATRHRMPARAAADLMHETSVMRSFFISTSGCWPPAPRSLRDSREVRASSVQ